MSPYMDLMTVEEIAEKLRVTANWVYLHADEMGVIRLGKYLRFSWQRVLECLEGRNKSLDCLHNNPLKDTAFTTHITDQEQTGNKTVD
jgi:hypothetical protein